MDDELKKALLRNLTREDILELFDAEIPTEVNQNPEFKVDPIPASQHYYRTQRIPGSTKKCPFCSRDLVNNEEHAIELMGGENH